MAKDGNSFRERYIRQIAQAVLHQTGNAALAIRDFYQNAEARGPQVWPTAAAFETFKFYVDGELAFGAVHASASPVNPASAAYEREIETGRIDAQSSPRLASLDSAPEALLLAESTLYPNTYAQHHGTLMVVARLNGALRVRLTATADSTISLLENSGFSRQNYWVPYSNGSSDFLSERLPLEVRREELERLYPHSNQPNSGLGYFPNVEHWRQFKVQNANEVVRTSVGASR